VSIAVPQVTTRGLSARRSVAAVGVLLVAAVGAVLFIESGRSTKATDAAPDRPAVGFTLPGLRDGQPPVHLAAVPGKPTVVNFFAAWCVPCRTELPAFKAASDAHPEVAFLGVDHQDSRSDAIELLDEFGITYPAGYDPRGEIAAKYRIRGLPATVFIDARGRVTELHQGALSAAAIDAGVRALTLRDGGA